jgi:hypothetical protein
MKKSERNKRVKPEKVKNKATVRRIVAVAGTTKAA